MADQQNHYLPDYVHPPGETLLETIETIGLPQKYLAQLMGQPLKTIHAIIQGKAAITAEIASQLEQILHIPANFWLRSEQHYQASLVRQANEQRLQSWVGWLEEIPVQHMIQRGWIPTHTHKTLQVLELLRFFGAASPETWLAIWECTDIAYRKSSTCTSNLGSLSAWLRRGEIEAQIIDCPSYNEDTFRQALARIRSLTLEPIDLRQKELVQQCASAGVAVVFVPDYPKHALAAQPNG